MEVVGLSPKVNCIMRVIDFDKLTFLNFKFIVRNVFVDSYCTVIRDAKCPHWTKAVRNGSVCVQVIMI